MFLFFLNEYIIKKTRSYFTFLVMYIIKNKIYAHLKHDYHKRIRIKEGAAIIYLPPSFGSKFESFSGIAGTVLDSSMSAMILVSISVRNSPSIE